MRITRTLVVAAMTSAFLWGGCDGDGGPPVPVASVDVTPTADTVRAGLTIQLTATPRDADGNALTGRRIDWSSDNETVAEVDATGLVTGLSAGTATITAESEGQSGTADVAVWVGITGTWSGTIDAPSGECPLDMSVTEDDSGNVTGSSQLGFPCSEVALTVTGTNNTGGVADSVSLTFNEVGGPGSFGFEGAFDGGSSLAGLINGEGCTDCDTSFNRTSILASAPSAQVRLGSAVSESERGRLFRRD
jgi:hypothetical protein